MNSKKIYPWLILFTVLNLLTALLTELYNDEAYYWAYSRYLDWGYFDHPPTIAVLIKLGYAIFSNELGVRLLSVLSISAALWLIYKIAGANDVKLFVLLMFSVFPFFLFGFTALPDSPMLFTIALFLWIYQQFIRNESWKWAILLGLAMALMLYTKYMGVLVILFTLTSNMSLLKRKWFWMASIFGTTLFLPHLYWQYVNDFPSVKYHLVDRSAKIYDYTFTLEYILAQLFFYGPFVGIFLYWAAWQIKTKDLFVKALKYVVGGTLVFFLLSSFKGRVEVNWTLGMLVPLMILALIYFQEASVPRAWLLRMAWITIPIILLVRIHVIYPLGDFKNDRAKDFHGHRDWANSVVKQAAGLPIVAHRYQTASSLWFYTGKPVPVLNLNTRFSQYDLWQFDTTRVNQSVAFVSKVMRSGNPLIGGLTLTKLDSFPVFKLIAPAVQFMDDDYVLQIEWRKPVTFYAFINRYPILAKIDFLNKGGQTVFTRTIQLNPKKKVLPLEIPQDLVNSIKNTQITLFSDELGILRRFPMVELAQ